MPCAWHIFCAAVENICMPPPRFFCPCAYAVALCPTLPVSPILFPPLACHHHLSSLLFFMSMPNSLILSNQDKNVFDRGWLGRTVYFCSLGQGKGGMVDMAGSQLTGTHGTRRATWQDWEEVLQAGKPPFPQCRAVFATTGAPARILLQIYGVCLVGVLSHTSLSKILAKNSSFR